MLFKLLNRYSKIIASYNLGHPFYVPDSVSVIVTNKCNLRCEMCDFWKDGNNNRNIITLDEFETLFRDLCSYGVRAVQFTGGEPFLRRDLSEVLKSAKVNNLNTTLITNGTLVDADNAMQYAANTDLFYISLDTPSKEQHETIRGVPGIFDKIIKSITLLVRTIKNNSFSSKVVLCSTITPKAIHDPEKMVELAKHLGVDGIIYNPATSVNYGYTTLKSTLFNDDVSRNAYCEMIDKIIRLASDNTRSLIRSNPFYLAASKEFLNGNKKYYRFSCYSGGYNGPLIGFDGTIFPCCAWNIPLGNIREQSFSNIWRSSHVKGIRRKIKKGQCPVCYHHNRTFDFVVRAPLLFKNFNTLLDGYKTIFRTRI